MGTEVDQSNAGYEVPQGNCVRIFRRACVQNVPVGSGRKIAPLRKLKRVRRVFQAKTNKFNRPKIEEKYLVESIAQQLIKSLSKGAKIQHP